MTDIKPIELKLKLKTEAQRKRGVLINLLLPCEGTLPAQIFFGSVLILSYGAQSKELAFTVLGLVGICLVANVVAGALSALNNQLAPESTAPFLLECCQKYPAVQDVITQVKALGRTLTNWEVTEIKMYVDKVEAARKLEKDLLVCKQLNEVA